MGVNDGADRRIKPFYFFRVSLGDQGQFYFQNSILQRLASLFISRRRISKRRLRPEKACSTSGAFLFGEWYATRSTNNSFSNRAHMNYRKNPGNIFLNHASTALSSHPEPLFRLIYSVVADLSFSLGRARRNSRLDRKSIRQVTMELCTEIDGAAAT